MNTLAPRALLALPCLLLAAAAPTQGAAPDAAPVGERPASRTADQAFLRDQGVLLPAWSQTIELSGAYARSVQEFGSARREATAAEARIAWRLGIADDVQVSARLPWRTQREGFFVQPGAASGGFQASSTRRALGDLSVGLFAVLLREGRGWPNLLLGIDGVLPTGPGESGVGGGLAVTKAYDPVILFAGAAYARGFRPRPDDATRQLSRNNVSFNAGVAFAMNESVAVTGQLVGAIHDFESSSPPRPLREQYRLQLGVTLLVAPGLFVEPTVAVAVASGSPDLTIGLNVPWSF